MSSLFLSDHAMAVDTCTFDSVGTTTINGAGSYKMTYNADSTTKGRGMTSMRAIFPSGSGVRPYAGISTFCISLNPPGAVVTCSVKTDSNGQFLAVVSGLSTSSTVTSYVVQFIVGIQNSDVGKTVTGIGCDACNDATCDAVIGSSDRNIRVTFQPQYIQDVTDIQTSVNVNGDINSTLTISFKPFNDVVVNPVIYLRLPKANANYLNKGTTVGQPLIYKLDQGGKYTVDCKYGLASSTSRTTLVVTKVDVTLDPTFGFDDLKIHISSSSIIPGKTQAIDIVIHPIQNPPSLNPLEGFIVKTGDSNANWIDVAQTGIKFNTNTAGVFQYYSQGADQYFSKIEIVNGLNEVSLTPVDYKFTLYTSNDIPLGSVLQVQFPSSWTLDCTAALPGVKCDQSCNFQQANIVCDSISNAYTFYKGFETTFAYVYKPGPIIFSILGLTNPPTTQTISFTVSTYDNDGSLYPIDRSNNLFSLTFVPGKITINKVTANDAQLNSKTGTWNVEFTPQHNLEPNYLIRLKFPTELGVQQLAKCTITGVSPTINTAYKCKGDAANNQIVIENLYLTSVVGGSTVSFRVNGISNPDDYIDPGKAEFFTEDPINGGNVDGGSFQFGKNLFTKGYVDILQVTNQNSTNGAFPAKYSFLLKPKARIAKGAIIEIEIPDEIRPSDVTQLKMSCLKNRPIENGFSAIIFECDYFENNNTIKIYNGFKYEPSLFDPPTLRWEIDYLKNPRGLITSGMFNCTIYNKNLQVLFQNINPVGPNVTMTGLPGPVSISYTRSNLTNSEYYNMTLKLKATNYIELFDSIDLQLPKPIYFTNTTQCIGNNKWTKGFIRCNVSEDLRSVTLNMSIAGRYNSYYRKLKEKTIDLCFEGDDKCLEDDSNDRFDFNDELPTRGRRLYERYIPADTEMMITFTNMTPAVSLRPTSGMIAYNLTSYTGAALEKGEVNLTFENTNVAVMNYSLAGVTPNLWDKGRLANYTLQYVPVGYEIDMWIEIYINKKIIVPDEFSKNPESCLGLKGTDRLTLACEYDRKEHKIKLTNLFESREVKPEKVEIVFQNLKNPIKNVKLDSWRIKTYTWDNYAIDVLDRGMDINFYCEFPCHTCNETRNDLCFECYGPAATKWIYFWKQKCLDHCPVGMYETYTNITVDGPKIFTCDFCQGPCKTCDKNKTDCLTCIDNYIYYDVDHTCYADFSYYFPLLGLAILSVLFVWAADCYFRETNTLYSALYFLSIIEDLSIAYYLYMFVLGNVPGERDLALSSFAFHLVLNFAFIFIHLRGIAGDPTPQYKQLKRDFKCTYHCCNIMTYLFNFKMSLFLISYFFGRVRFAGRFSSDNWQKFNTFSVLWLLSVYSCFMIDFYQFFMIHGTRHIMSYISFEHLLIQTMIAVVLIMILIEHCTMGGMHQKDLAKRAGITKKTRKAKRKVARQGMGNDESSYGSEYSSEVDDEELRQFEMELEEALRNRAQQQDDDDSRSQVSNNQIKINQLDESTDDKNQSSSSLLKKTPRDGLDDLAQIQKEERERAEKLKQEELEKEIQRLKDEQEEMHQVVADELQNKLGEWNGSQYCNPLGHWIIPLPLPVNQVIDYIREVEGDEEYWIQNQPIKGDISDRSKVLERDASVIQYFDNDEGEAEDNITNDQRSKIATDRQYYRDDQSAMYSNIDLTKSVQGKTFDRDISGDLELLAGKSADHGKVSDDGKNYQKSKLDEQIDQKSAEFGNASTFQGYQKSIEDEKYNFDQNHSAEYGGLPTNSRYDLSQMNSYEKTLPVQDQEGHSEESSEGIVANHDPFNGIKNALENQNQEKPLPDSGSDDENLPSGRRRVKQVLYSDKSESSVDDMMEDTPSNYNIANGRLEGKSMGLKAIILYAKNQGINLGEQNPPLPRIQEADSSGEDAGQWKNMNNPLNTIGQTQIVGEQSKVLKTLDDENRGNKRGTQKKPDIQKQYLEERQESVKSTLKKNNFI